MTVLAMGAAMENETEGTSMDDPTLRGVIRPVTLEPEFLGAVTDPWKSTCAGVTTTGDIDREDFALVGNEALENGGLVVGDTVEITLEVAGILQE